jgi:hypothetical protein
MQSTFDNREPDAADKDFFQRLRRELENEISNYVYEVHPEAIGTPLSTDVIHTYLNSMRLCLVEPHWEEVDLCITDLGVSPQVRAKRICVTMAEDEGYVLVFDPVDELYHLAWRGENRLCTFGIFGNGVECFLAR